jgi:DNA-binding NtrC family response regulator
MAPTRLVTRCAALGLDAAFLRRIRDAGAATGLQLDEVQGLRDPAFEAADVTLVATSRTTVREAFAAGARLVVACVAQGDADAAVRAIQDGAADSVTPRAQGAEVAARLVAAAARRSREQVLESAIRLFGEPPQLVGQSPAMRRVREIVQHVAGADAPVRIEGEQGTGRTLVARIVHHLSPRHDLPLFVVDAGRLSPGEAGRRLFGAGEDCGALWSARGTTLVLRSAERLDGSTQLALARWLRTRRIGVGPHAAEESDARLVVTAAPSLDALAARGTVRDDFVAALSALRVGLPPLRDRPGDAEPLLAHFLHAAGHETPRLDDAARRLLRSHAWPGNVAEVRGVAALLASRGPFDELGEADLLPLLAFPRPRPAAAGALDGVPTLHDVSLGHIVRVLALAGGVRTRAAKALGISPRTLYNHLHERPGGGAAEAP